MSKVLLKGRSRILFFDWGFTFYKVTDEYISIKRGMLTTSNDKELLYTIMDADYTQTVLQKLLFHTGNLTLICRGSNGEKEIVLENVPNPDRLSERILDLATKKRNSMDFHISEGLGGFNNNQNVYQEQQNYSRNSDHDDGWF